MSAVSGFGVIQAGDGSDENNAPWTDREWFFAAAGGCSQTVAKNEGLTRINSGTQQIVKNGYAINNMLNHQQNKAYLGYISGGPSRTRTCDTRIMSPTSAVAANVF